MQKWITSIVFLFLFITAKAHQPDISTTMMVETSDNEWIIQIRASLTAFEYEVEVNFGKDSYTSPEEFRAQVLEHLIEHISIEANENVKVNLKSGVVKLGHESVVTFQIENLPQNLNELIIKNSSFSDVARNQSALLILKKGFDKEQFVLNNENGHEVQLVEKDSKLTLVTEHAKTKSSYYAFSAVFGVMALGLIVFKIRGANKNDKTI